MGTGAVAYFLNNKAMALFNEHVEYFVETTVNEADLCPNCPDVYTGLLMALLGVKHVGFPPRWHGAFSVAALDHRGPAVTHKEFFANHYVAPRKMIAMHQRATHEKIDRIVNTGNAQAVVDYFREFVESHFYVLRKRQQEVVALAKKHGEDIREYDVPNPLTFVHNVANEFGSPLPPICPLYNMSKGKLK